MKLDTLISGYWGALYQIWRYIYPTHIKEAVLILLLLPSFITNHKSGMVWSGLVWSGMVWSYMVWSSMVWSGMVWSGMVWSGMVWSGMV